MEAASKVRMKVFSAAPDVKALKDRLNTVKEEKKRLLRLKIFREKAGKLRDEEQSLLKRNW